MIHAHTLRNMGARKFRSEGTSVQNAQSNNGAEGIDLETVPKKRGKRVVFASKVLFIITIIIVTVISVKDREEVVYYIDPYLRNNTNCYTRKAKITYSCLLQASSFTFGVGVGTLVERLLLLAEERHHFYQRYQGSWKKITTACLRGIAWRGVFCLLSLPFLINFIIIAFNSEINWFRSCDFARILCGISAGPLIMHLLNNHTECEVYNSTILENNGMNLSNVLAWSYYFNYLKPAAQIFEEQTRSRSDISLSLTKLVLLISLDYEIPDDLEKIDSYITLTSREHYYSIYNLSTVEGQPQRCLAIQCVQQPLRTLRSMKSFQKMMASNMTIFGQDVKLLYRTLCEILEVDAEIKHTFLLVPIKTKNLETLQNGGLVKNIIAAVHRSSTQDICVSRLKRNYSETTIRRQPTLVELIPPAVDPSSTQDICVSGLTHGNFPTTIRQPAIPVELIHEKPQFGQWVKKPQSSGDVATIPNPNPNATISMALKPKKPYENKPLMRKYHQKETILESEETKKPKMRFVDMTDDITIMV